MLGRCSRRTTQSAAKPAVSAWLHPLLHANTSDLSRQSYASVFTGEEFFLRDHKVKGENVLPAVAYLEMARAAVEFASPGSAEAGTLELRNTVWAEPIAVAGAKEVSIALSADESDEQIEFEICSVDVKRKTDGADHSRAAAQSRETLHCQGQAFSPATLRPPSSTLNASKPR
jgi:hypothetical protein